MKTRIDTSSRIPEPAHLAASALRRHDHVDSYSLRLSASAPGVDELLIAVLTDLPGRVTFMQSLRDRLVGVLGLKTGGSDEALGHSELPLRPGGRVACFPVTARETDAVRDEVLLGGNDRHLDLRVSHDYKLCLLVSLAAGGYTSVVRQTGLWVAGTRGSRSEYAVRHDARGDPSSCQ